MKTCVLKATNAFSFSLWIINIANEQAVLSKKTFGFSFKSSFNGAFIKQRFYNGKWNELIKSYYELLSTIIKVRIPNNSTNYYNNDVVIFIV